MPVTKIETSEGYRASVRCRAQGTETILHINTTDLLQVLEQAIWGGDCPEFKERARTIRAAIIEQCR